MSKINDMLGEGRSQYYASREPGDLDLVLIIAEALKDAGLSEEKLSIYYNAPFILEAANKAPAVQRFLINRFWYNQFLTLSDIETVDERFSLINDGSIEDWIMIFKTGALPSIVKYNLPIML